MSDGRGLKFSIIVPTYNRANLVFRALDSALAQTHENFEILVVDDGSTDETPTLFARYRHPKVSYLRKDNGERGAARNFGARRATGEYLNFLDSDDFLLPNHLEAARRCVDTFGRPEVFGVAFRIEDAQGRVKQTLNDLPDPINDVLLRGNVLGCDPVFVRNDVFAQNPFDETRSLAGTEDWLLWLRLSARFPFRFWNEVSSVLVDHGGRSVYSAQEDKLEARAQVLLRRLGEDPIFIARYGSQLPKIRSFRHVYTALHLALAGQVRPPLVHLLKAVATAPSGVLRRATLGTIKHVLLNVAFRFKLGRLRFQP